MAATGAAVVAAAAVVAVALGAVGAWAKDIAATLESRAATSRVLVVVMVDSGKRLVLAPSLSSGPGICPACIYNVGFTPAVYVKESKPEALA